MRRRRAFGLESEFEVVDDVVYDFMIFDKSNDFHFCTAVGTEEGVYLIDLADHLGPAFGGHMAVLFLNDQRVEGIATGLAHLSSVGIGIKTVVTNHDLTFIGNVRGHSGNKFQIIHTFQFQVAFVILVEEPAFSLIKA